MSIQRHCSRARWKKSSISRPDRSSFTPTSPRHREKSSALREERAALLGKLIEAARIHESDKPNEDGESPFDLASFISELRSEALAPKAPPVQSHPNNSSTISPSAGAADPKAAKAPTPPSAVA